MKNAMLPLEITLHVLQFVDKATLKSLRQCSKRLELATTSVLFKEVVVLPYRSSFTGLIDLAKNRNIRNAVKQVRYETHGAFPETFPPSEETDDIDIWFEDLAYLEHNHPGLCSYLEVLRESWLCPDLEGYYYQCLSSRSEDRTEVNCQCEMHLFTQLIDAYPSVKDVRLTSKPFLRKMYGRERSVARPIPQYFQRWFDAHKRTPKVPTPTLLSCCFSTGGTNIVSYRAQSVLFALCMHEQRTFNVEMEGIQGRLFARTYLERSISNVWRYNGLRNVECLQLHFQKESQSLVTYPEDFTKLADLLAQNKIIVQLGFNFYDPNQGSRYLIHEITSKNVSLPLKRLELSNFMLPGSVLVAFWRLVAPTLYTLRLDTIHLGGTVDAPGLHDNWIYIIEWLAENMSLCDISFSGALKGHNHEVLTSIWHQAEKDINNSRITKSVPAYLEETYNMSAFSMDETYHVLDATTEMIGNPGKGNCLAGRICDYIRGKGSYPIQLHDFSNKTKEMNTDAAIKPRLIGDYSWAMVVGQYTFTPHKHRPIMSHAC